MCTALKTCMLVLYVYVFTPLHLSKYALIAHSKYEGSYLLSRVTVDIPSEE